MKNNLEKLKDIVKIQCSEGNWNANDYMLGMANGLILAEAILEEKEPKYLTKPKEGYLSENIIKPTTVNTKGKS